MNRLLLTLAALLCAALLLVPSRADEQPPKDKPKDDPLRTDLTRPESPKRPAPEWVKVIDQGTRDPKLKGYFTPEGLKVEVVAEAPAVVNPVGMTFGPDGTPYVLEWVPDAGANFPEVKETFTYKDGSTRKVATMKKRVKDVVKVLSASKEGGPWDTAKVILEDELPSSILVHDGWIYLSGRGTIRRYKQSKPGGPYDVKEVIAQGFCGFHHHQVSGMTLGNDGWLYVTSGDDDNFVEGSDGSRATVLRTGAVFRMRPDGSKVETYSLGYRNPYRDVAFDVGFNLFHVDNDNEDGSKFTGCRLMHVAEGTDFGWRLKVGSRCCVPDSVRGAVFGELPGKVPAMLKTGRGAPAGLLIYNDTFFPEQYRGLLLYPDVFRKLIRAYVVERRGSTFAVTQEFEFLKSDDPLFRPCQMLLGPDGAMYVVDWRTDSGGAGRLWGDGKNGRIYRITWGGTKDQEAIKPRVMDSWEKIAKQDDAGLVKTLSSPNFSDRQVAQRELVKRGEKNRDALLKLLAAEDTPTEAQIAALGALESFWNGDVQKACEGLLESGENDLRRLAAEAIGHNAKPGDKDAHEALLKALSDNNLAVRRSVALAMGRVGSPGAADALVNTLSFNEGKDLYLRDALVRAIERLGKPGLQRLLELADSGVPADLDKVVEAFSMMRERPASEVAPQLLKNPHLSIAQRAALIRSFNNYQLDPPVSLDPVVAYLVKNKDEDATVKLAGLEVLSSNGALAGDSAKEWLLGLLDETDDKVRLSTVKAIEDTKLTKAAPTLVKWLGDDRRPTPERIAVAKALRALGDKSAVAPLEAILAAKDTSPEAVALKTESLRALASLDPAAAGKSATKLLDDKNPALQAEAVQVLAATADGARQVARLYLDKKLPTTLLPQVSAALRNHAGKDAECAKLLAEVMKAGLVLSNKPEDVERVRQLVAAKGDPNRGRAVYLNAKTLACTTCHRLEGVGGQVGPDLTRIWETMSVEKIMESIIDPSKEIKEGFTSYTATTKKGQVYNGLKISQTADEVVLRDATGKDVHIRAKDLDELAPSKVSLMPDNAVAQLSFDDFVHLVAFLKNRKAQESLRGLALDFHTVGPFGGDLKTAYPPEKKPDPTAAYPDPAKPDAELKWQPLAAEPSGLLNLRAAYNKDRASVYALTYVYSPKGQKAEILLGFDDQVRVWVNDQQVFEYAEGAHAARPDDQRVPVELREGWNAVLVKVVNLDGDHGLYLRFAGDGLRVSRTPADTLPAPK